MKNIRICAVSVMLLFNAMNFYAQSSILHSVAIDSLEKRLASISPETQEYADALLELSWIMLGVNKAKGEDYTLRAYQSAKKIGYKRVEAMALMTGSDYSIQDFQTAPSFSIAKEFSSQDKILQVFAVVGEVIQKKYLANGLWQKADSILNELKPMIDELYVLESQQRIPPFYVYCIHARWVFDLQIRIALQSGDIDRYIRQMRLRSTTDSAFISKTVYARQGLLSHRIDLLNRTKQKLWLDSTDEGMKKFRALYEPILVEASNDSLLHILNFEVAHNILAIHFARAKDTINAITVVLTVL